MGAQSRFGSATSRSNRLNSSLHRCAYPLGSWLPCALRPSTHRIGCNPVRGPFRSVHTGQRWPRRISNFRPSRIEPIHTCSNPEAAALSRMGWEESTPLEQDQIRSQDRALDLPRPLNGNEASFLTIDDPGLLLDTWKPAEDGKGTILRFIDLGGEPRTVTVHTPLLSISNIVETDAVERDQKPIEPEDVHTFKIAVRAHQILTVRLIFQSKH